MYVDGSNGTKDQKGKSLSIDTKNFKDVFLSKTPLKV